MARNHLLLVDRAGPPPAALRIARASGGETGLVVTEIELRREKVSGGRIEEERDYGGLAVSALDEPVFVGSAIAQLAGHCDAVILDGLETWVERVIERFPDDPIEREAEILSLASVLQARMAELIIVARPGRAATGAAAELLRKAVAATTANSDECIECRGEETRPIARPT